MPRAFRIIKYARSDLVGIWQYIAADNEAAAEATLDAFNRCFKMLVGHPNLGREVSELATALRRIPSGNYHVYFRRNGD
jgi:toxin ParE1/3/4